MGTLAESEKNVTNLARLSIGMNQSEVLCIMRKPYTQETVQLDPDVYEVWFYVTMPTAMGQNRMVRANLTPLTFKNGALVSMGNDYYKWLIKQERIAADLKTNSQNKPVEPLEDTDLEKALQPDPNAKPQTPPAPKAPSKPVSMSAKPQKQQPSEDEEDKKPEKKKPPLNKEDKQMIELEGEQNFDFW
jgi:hypothetical protein